MVPYSRSSAAGTHRAPTAGLEESMSRMGFGGGGDQVYPERPGEQVCSYYIRTGCCAYGVKCRYNHPRDRGAVTNVAQLGALEYPECFDQPVCEYFLKTGKCRYGSMCKYHHPRHGVGSVSLNYYSCHLRQGEKECSYYVKTGQCKFGSACKFHHPQPLSVSSSVPLPAPTVYPVVQPPLVPSPQQYPSLASWQVDLTEYCSIPPTSYMPGSYGSMLISPSILPVSGWSPYPPPVNPTLSPSGQEIVQAGVSYGLPYQSSPASAHPGPFPPISSSAGHSSIQQKEYKLPERPGQPICQYYMRAGACKFGTMCKYHHPPAWRTLYSNGISAFGLPLRPGAQPCPHYAQHGGCNFGLACKYDHPVGTLSYNPSASSLSDAAVAPYLIGFSLATLAPSTSYQDPQI